MTVTVACPEKKDETRQSACQNIRKLKDTVEITRDVPARSVLQA